MKRRKFILEIICCLFIVLFAYTGVSKLIDIRNFNMDIVNIEFMKKWNLNRVFGIGVPVLEILVALSLLFSKTRQTGLFACLLLMTLFTAYVGGILAYSKDLPCTCGGVLREMTWSQHLWFNIGFTALAFFGLYLYRRQDGTKDVLGGSASLA